MGVQGEFAGKRRDRDVVGKGMGTAGRALPGFGWGQTCKL